MCHIPTSLAKSFWLILYLDKRQATLALPPPMTPPPEHTASCQMFSCVHKNTAAWTHGKWRHRGTHTSSCHPAEFHSESSLPMSILHSKLHYHVQVNARLQLCGLKRASYDPQMLHLSQINEIQLSKSTYCNLKFCFGQKSSWFTTQGSLHSDSKGHG